MTRRQHLKRAAAACTLRCFSAHLAKSPRSLRLKAFQDSESSSRNPNYNPFSRMQLAIQFSTRRLGQFRDSLLAWYDANRRDLPWRKTGDPYLIWISEIMLQQTRVTAVLPRYDEFIRKFPSVT